MTTAWHVPGSPEASLNQDVQERLSRNMAMIMLKMPTATSMVTQTWNRGQADTSACVGGRALPRMKCMALPPICTYNYIATLMPSASSHQSYLGIPPSGIAHSEGSPVDNPQALCQGRPLVVGAAVCEATEESEPQHCGYGICLPSAKPGGNKPSVVTRRSVLRA